MQLPKHYSQMNQRERKECREYYIKIQKNKCYCCGEPLDGLPPERIMKMPINWKLFPPFFTRHPVHLHHSHDTDETLGAVHAHCNAYLWQYHGE